MKRSQSLSLIAAAACAVLLGCGGVGAIEADAGPDPAVDGGDPAPDAAAPLATGVSLHYFFEGRACMSDADANGERTAAEPLVPCTTDAHCGGDPAFASCRHLEDASNSPPLADFEPPLVNPPLPEPAAQPSDYRHRYVPLCADGTGTHEHAVYGATEPGDAPTCAPQDYIRCTDGTRPSYFVNTANQASNDWLIWAGSGGFSLLSEATAWRGIHQERSSFGSDPKSSRGGLGGVFANESSTPFDNVNRVWIDKCTPDRFQGRATATETASATLCEGRDLCDGTLEPPAHDETRPVEIYFHGARIVEAVLTDLAGGVALYDDEGNVLTTSASLVDGESVALSCHSNGCNGLQLSFDERAEFIEAIAPSATVKAVFNNFFIAALEGEHAALEGFPEGNLDNTRSLYDHVTTGFSIALDELGAFRPISATTYATGEAALTLERYGATLDASCLAFHEGDSTAPCHDTIHVLANHLSHEFFYVLSQRDQSLIEGGGVKAPHCDGNDVLPGGCLFDGVEIPWVALIRKQLSDIILLAETERCEASDGPGPYGRTGVWAPDRTIHAGWQDTEVATNVLSLPATGPTPLFQAAFNWLSGGPRRVFVEDIVVVDGSARNAALGLPTATTP